MVIYYMYIDVNTFLYTLEKIPVEDIQKRWHSSQKGSTSMIAYRISSTSWSSWMDNT